MDIVLITLFGFVSTGQCIKSFEPVSRRDISNERLLETGFEWNSYPCVDEKPKEAKGACLENHVVREMMVDQVFSE